MHQDHLQTAPGPPKKIAWPWALVLGVSVHKPWTLQGATSTVVQISSELNNICNKNQHQATTSAIVAVAVVDALPPSILDLLEAFVFLSVPSALAATTPAGRLDGNKTMKNYQTALKWIRMAP